MKQAVVTGGAGFIGSHLTKALLEQGVQVTVIDDLSSGKAASIPPEAGFFKTDVASTEARDKIAELAPDVVFHLAAQADVQRSIQNPLADCETNVAGTLQVLAGLRQAGRGKIVFASTSAVYGMLQKEQIREEDPTAAVSFYGLSKRTAEDYIRLHHSLYCTRYTILRYGNVYGPGQTPKGEGGVVAVFLERLKRGEPLTIYGDGEQTRDFIYVKDIVSANLAALERGDGETINVSTGRTTRIRALAEKMREEAGAATPIHYAPAKAGDIRHSCLDNSRLLQVLMAEPRHSVDQGLRETLRSAGLLPGHQPDETDIP